jgi:hypothetical protein
MMAVNNCFLWEIKKGDLVKLKDYPTGREDDYIYVKGIVISEIKHNNEQQLPIWPSVDVYVFQTGTVRECIPGSVEIISIS